MRKSFLATDVIRGQKSSNIGFDNFGSFFFTKSNDLLSIFGTKKCEKL
jgi:hypothetical protein